MRRSHFVLPSLVSLALVASASATLTPFADNFDNNFVAEPGINGAVWPKWPTATDHLNGSSAENHTPGGTTSAKLDQEYTTGFANYHDFGSTAGSVDATVWVFDDLRVGSGSPLDGVGSTGPVNFYFGFYGDATNPTTDTNHLLMGLDPKYSTDGTTDNNYGVTTGAGGVSSYYTSSVTRTAAVAGSPDGSGWLKLEVQADALTTDGGDGQVRFYVNNVLIDTATRASGVNLRYLYMGAYNFLGGGHGGENYGDFWFDDVTVTPEPASLSLLALGAGGLLMRRRRTA